MTPEQVELVQRSWRQIAPGADEAATLFYHRLFALDPELRPLFRVDMKEQGQKLMSMLALAVNALERIETLAPALGELGRRHAGYGVRDPHYETVASALLWTLEKGLGPTFTPEVREAWISTYHTLAGVMRFAARPEPGVRPVN